MRKRSKARLRCRFLAQTPTDMRNTMGAELGKDEKAAQFGTESEVSVRHLERSPRGRSGIKRELSENLWWL